MCKILGIGVIADLDRQSPTLCSKLWLDLDIVPMVVTSNPVLRPGRIQAKPPKVNEIADSAARKCLAYDALPLLQKLRG
jgi:alpha,alpha-trehalose phosphorylase (configuration-retaining)